MRVLGRAVLISLAFAAHAADAQTYTFKNDGTATLLCECVVGICVPIGTKEAPTEAFGRSIEVKKGMQVDIAQACFNKRQEKKTMGLCCGDKDGWEKASQFFKAAVSKEP